MMLAHFLGRWLTCLLILCCSCAPKEFVFVGADGGGGSNPADGGGGSNPADGGSAPATGVIQVDAGILHTCALLDTGAVRCWGYNEDGQLGYGNTKSIGDNETPAAAGDVDVGAKVTQIVTGKYHTCALLETGAVRCWGYGAFGQLGYGNLGNIGDDEMPASAGDVDVGAKVTQVAAGDWHTCALLVGGAVRCWGHAYEGQLGYGNTDAIGDDEMPASAGDVDVGAKVTQIAAGEAYTCVLLETGAVRCWGTDSRGKLGYNNTNDIGDDETPASAGDVDVGAKVNQVAAGEFHTCALVETGAVRCWGFGEFGQLGYANTNDIGDDETPAAAGDVDVGAKVNQIAIGRLHTCALLDTGAIRCWGLSQHGQLGYGINDQIGDDETPASAGDVDLGAKLTQVASGSEHNCALLETKAVRCWGQGDFGQLGYGNTNNIGDDETPASAGDVPVL